MSALIRASFRLFSEFHNQPYTIAPGFGVFALPPEPVAGTVYVIAQRRLIARISALFKAYTEGRAWNAIGDVFLKPCYLSTDDHNWKIRTRKQRIDIGKYFFVNRTIKSWNKLPAVLLVSFLCKIITYRKRFKNVVTSKEIQFGIECK